MARLRQDSDEEFPDLAVVIKNRSRRPPPSSTEPRNIIKSSQDDNGVEQADAPPKTADPGAEEELPLSSGETVSASLVSKELQTKTPARRQRALKSHNSMNSKHFPSFLAPSRSLFAEKEAGCVASEPRTSRRQSPTRKIQRAIYHETTCTSPLAPDAESEESSWSADTASEGEEDSVVELDFQTRPKLMPLKFSKTPWKDASEHRESKSKPGYMESETRWKLSSQQMITTDLGPAIRSLSFVEAPQRPLAPTWTVSRPPSSSDNDCKAILTFNPPKRLSPAKVPPQRPSTPPPAPPGPSKSRLASPSKKKERIPTPPHRPSIDAFWSQSVINEWNDQHSPRKTLQSPKKLRSPLKSTFLLNTTSFSDDDDVPSPSASPRKSPMKTRDKAALEARKAFEAQKCGIAEAFLRELDEQITGGKVAELASSSGGVKIVWSKKLNSTAGRANWKRETLRKKGSDGEVGIEVKHHASVELAEKVIDCEERLINVLAHEYCHLANFMISGIKDNPHGKEFKAWAKKCSAAFGHRGVEVTTKHSYAIDYKYIWECVSCGHEFKRHSKSIDPAKHTCGACKSKLIQTKPPVRNVKTSEYQLFVKEHFQRVKRENGGASHGVVMELIGKLYREQKAQKTQQADAAKDAGKADNVDTVVRALETITLDD